MFNLTPRCDLPETIVPKYCDSPLYELYLSNGKYAITYLCMNSTFENSKLTAKPNRSHP